MVMRFFDANGDGRVTKDELTQWLRTSRLNGRT